VGLPGEAECAIIGCGYTGLSATLTLTLARLRHRPLVLDMEPIGFAASSRNGGMVSGALKVTSATLAARLGRERAERLVREAAGRLGFVEETIVREGID
jgi:glycine/D-amino acid oxidase-like deaminating enzyme